MNPNISLCDCLASGQIKEYEYVLLSLMSTNSQRALVCCGHIPAGDLHNGDEGAIVMVEGSDGPVLPLSRSLGSG